MRKSVSITTTYLFFSISDLKYFFHILGGHVSFLHHFGFSLLQFLKELGRFLSHRYAAGSLSPAGSHNYSSRVLAADTRAIFRFAKMTSPLTGTYTFWLLVVQHLGLAKNTYNTHMVRIRTHTWSIY